jgi:hypothetical protein
VAALDGDWSIDLGGKQVTTAIKPWEELGTTGFAGPATYKKQFTAPATPKGKHVYLEIADVHDYAHVTLNGKEVGARAFQPYRWDVTSALKKGSNDLVIEVDATVERQAGPGGAPPAAAAAPAVGLTTAPGAGAAGAGGAGGGRRRQGAAGAGQAAASGAPAAPPAGGAGRPAAAAPPTSGLLGEVKLVAY